jgi:hypothetical protein
MFPHYTTAHPPLHSVLLQCVHVLCLFFFLASPSLLLFTARFSALIISGASFSTTQSSWLLHLPGDLGSYATVQVALADGRQAAFRAAKGAHQNFLGWREWRTVSASCCRSTHAAPWHYVMWMVNFEVTTAEVSTLCHT